MTEESVGGSAGLRNKSNIEIMHQRRYRGKALNETDEEGKGIQVQSTYYMEITDITDQYKKNPEKDKEPPKSYWVVTWHKADHVEGALFENKTEAQKKYDDLFTEAKWAIAFYDQNMTQIAKS